MLSAGIFGRLLPVILLLGSLAAPVQADDGLDRPSVELFFYHNWPYFYRSEEDRVVGTHAGIITHLIEQAGVDYRFSSLSWERAQLNADTRSNALLAPLTRLPYREGNYHWIKKLYGARHDVVARADLDLEAVREHGLASGKWTAVCYKGSFQCQQLLDFGLPPENMLSISGVTTAQAIQMILRGRADLYMVDVATILGGDQLLGGDQPPLVLVPGHFVVVDEYLAAPIDLEPWLVDRFISTAAGKVLK